MARAYIMSSVSLSHESKIHFGERRIINFFILCEQLLGSRLFSMSLAPLRSAYLRRLQTRLAGRGAPEARTVDRRKDLSQNEFFKTYFNRSQPVIFDGAALSWPCCRKWDLDYLAETCGRSDLLLVDAQGLTTREDKKGFEFLSVKELVGDIKNKGEKYLRFSPLLHEHPELTEDLDMRWLGNMRYGNTIGNTYYMFVGGAGKKTYLHADQPCNLYVQVYGQKRWTLYMPEDSACLYPTVTNTAYVRSPVDIDRPDHDRFPLFKYARPYIADLKPGDVLYVPPHVWHQVENLTDTIAVGYRYTSFKAATRSSLTLSLVRLFSTNPPIWKTREYGKSDTNLIWAHTAGNIKDVLKQKTLRKRAAARAHEKNDR